jgi:hypothetical protein
MLLSTSVAAYAREMPVPHEPTGRPFTENMMSGPYLPWSCFARRSASASELWIVCSATSSSFVMRENGSGRRLAFTPWTAHSQRPLLRETRRRRATKRRDPRRFVGFEDRRFLRATRPQRLDERRRRLRVLRRRRLRVERRRDERRRLRVERRDVRRCDDLRCVVRRCDDLRCRLRPVLLRPLGVSCKRATRRFPRLMLTRLAVRLASFAARLRADASLRARATTRLPDMI